MQYPLILNNILAYCLIAFQNPDHRSNTDVDNLQKLATRIEAFGGQVYVDRDCPKGKGVGLYLGEVELVSQCLDSVKDWNDITYVDLSFSTVQEGDLEAFKSGKNIKLDGLSLAGTKANGKWVSTLAKLRNLSRLDLSYTPIDDTDCLTLASFDRLKLLNIESTKVSDKSMGVVGKLFRLEQLYLSNTNVSDVGLTHLAQLHSLKSLSLADTKIGNKSLNYITSAPKLTYLDISSTEVSDEGIKQLANSKNLEFVNIYDTRVGASGIDYFRKCERITGIAISSNAIDDSVINTLSKNKKLKKLFIDKEQGNLLNKIRLALPNVTVETFPSRKLPTRGR